MEEEEELSSLLLLPHNGHHQPVDCIWLFFVNYPFKLTMYIAHTVPGRYTLKPLSLVLYLEEEEEVVKMKHCYSGVIFENQLKRGWDKTKIAL
jgi:hypothetical protein